MSDPREEPDEEANRTLKLLCEFAAELIHKHRVPPETVARVAVAQAVMLFMEYNTDSAHAAAEWLQHDWVPAQPRR
jgi:hypothetical protein